MGALLKRPSLAICSPNPSAAHRWAAHALSGHQGTHSRLCPPVLWGHSPLSSGTGIGSVSQSRPLWTYELSPCCLLSPGLWRAASPSPTGCEGPGVPGLRAAPPRGVLVSEAPPCPWQFEIRAEHIALGVYQPPEKHTFCSAFRSEVPQTSSVQGPTTQAHLHACGLSCSYGKQDACTQPTAPSPLPAPGKGDQHSGIPWRHSRLGNTAG